MRDRSSSPRRYRRFGRSPRHTRVTHGYNNGSVSGRNSGKRLYVGNLSLKSREDDLWELFRDFQIDDIAFKETYAFVEFRRQHEMEKALRYLDGSRIVDQRVKLEVAKSEGPYPIPPRVSYASGYISSRSHTLGPYGLHIKNIPRNTSWAELKSFLRRYVAVDHVDCNKKILGQGELFLTSKSDVQYVLDKLNGKIFNGNPLQFYANNELTRRSSRRGRSNSPPAKRSHRESPQTCDVRNRSHTRSSSSGSSGSLVSQRSVRRYTSESLDDNESVANNLEKEWGTYEKKIPSDYENNNNNNNISRDEIKNNNNSAEHDKNPYCNFFESSKKKSNGSSSANRKNSIPNPSKLLKLDISHHVVSSHIDLSLKVCFFLNSILHSVITNSAD